MRRSLGTSACFGEQKPQARARALARDPEAVLRYVWFKATGRPSMAFEDYDPLTLEATLLHLGDAIKARRASAIAAEMRRERKRVFGRREPVGYEDAVLTGDPVADAWEREIAEGRVPDLNRKGR